MALIEVKVPDIGDFKEVQIIELLVKAGDTIKAEQSLITVESDKASMEIPSTHAGVVKEIKVAVGDKVAEGSLVLVLDAQAVPAAASSQPPPAQATRNDQQKAAVAVAPPPEPKEAQRDEGADEAAVTPSVRKSTPGALPHASPSIRKLARELGVPLSEVLGSGPKGRITQADVQGFVKGVMAGSVQTKVKKSTMAAGGGGFAGLLPWPQVDFSKSGPVERKELSRIKKISAANLHRNWVLIPHVTNHDDADITELEAFRVQLNMENEASGGKSGAKLTILAFLITACVAALKKFPDFNVSLESTSAGDQLVLKHYFNIGFAADTPAGLMVPVIKDADKKGLLQISQELSSLAKRAREGSLSPSDMSGGCFSISSLGGIGGRYFTPIINAPEVAILGVSKAVMTPVWDASKVGGSFRPRLMLPLSLSWDHRVVDGASAARFNAYLCSVLADFRRTLL